MDIKINPISKLNGELIAPSSKSYSHRAFIAASLADGLSVIRKPLNTGDVQITIDILHSLGVKILRESNDSYIIKGKKNFKSPNLTIDCKNSGTSLRIFSALSLLVEGGLSLTGEFLRKNRPILTLLEALKSLGAEYELKEDILKIERKNEGCNTIKIPGNISSQFITALLFLGSAIKCENRNYVDIEITSPLISYPYILITLEVLRTFGIHLLEKLDNEKKGKYLITCAQNYRAQLYQIPGDFSSAAFILAAAALTPEDSIIIINNLNTEDPQGDKKIVEILKEMGAKISVNSADKQIVIEGNINKNSLTGFEINCLDIPDLFPILSVVGAFAKGKTTLYNAAHLRSKESDRIAIMARELQKMGIQVEEKEDRLTVFHCDNIKGIEINHENDHRIAMACTIAALFASSSSKIKNIDIVKDSYPSFITDLEKLGVKIESFD